jgi:hypothetical protein
MRKYFATRGKLFPARRVAGERITFISQLNQNLRPRIEYEACRSYAQSTIISRATGFACRMFAAFAFAQEMGDGIEV